MLPEAALALGRVEERFGTLVLDVPVQSWRAAVAALQDSGFGFFDFLTATVADAGHEVLCHLVRLPGAQRVVVRTPVGVAGVPSLADLFAGAAWHEREVAEMFGVAFTDPTGTPLDSAALLLTPEAGHPLDKHVLLPSRVGTPWPGAKDPADTGGRTRRRLRPPGVPEEGR